MQVVLNEIQEMKRGSKLEGWEEYPCGAEKAIFNQEGLSSS